jgi:hypothetical protein
MCIVTQFLGDREYDKSPVSALCAANGDIAMVVWIDDAMVTDYIAESQTASKQSLNICTREWLNADVYFNLGGCVWAKDL